MQKRSCFLVILLSAGAALFLGCAQPRPYDYHPGTEIPKGPGLFTREAGVFTLFDSSKPVPDSPPPAEVNVDDNAQFQEFQQWRKERKDFEAFQRWKQTRQGTSEYEEFREWRKWQEYKQWQESQSGDR